MAPVNSFVDNLSACDKCCIMGLSLSIMAAFINWWSRSYSACEITTTIVGTVISKFSLAYKLTYILVDTPDHHHHMSSHCAVGVVIAMTGWIVHLVEKDCNPRRRNTWGQPVAITSTVTTVVIALIKGIVKTHELY